MRLSGRLVLVTGASSGIGWATTRRLAHAGARLALVARRREALEALAREIQSGGGMARAYPADLGDPTAVRRMAEAVRRELGVPDALVHAAGAGRWLFVEETPPEEAVRMMQAPYFAAFFVTQAFLPGMLERGRGVVCVINSPAALQPWPGATGYVAARWALRGFTEALRLDLRGTGIAVCSVVAGRVRSAYWQHNPGAIERVPRLARLIPDLTPEAVARVVVRALEKESRLVVVPWALRVMYALHPFAPRLAEALVWRTGYRHPRAGRRG